MRYRATTTLLTFPISEKETARIVKAREQGAPLPHEERKTYEVEPGVLIRYIPAQSIPWMLEQGLIEEVPSDV